MEIDYNSIITELGKLFFGGVVGVVFATWYKDFKSKKSAQKNLFTTLYALRGAPLNYQSVLGINQVEIIFSNKKEVLSAWNALRLELQVDEESKEQSMKILAKMNVLLGKMAHATGQTQVIDSIQSAHYYPKGFEFQAMREWNLKTAEFEYYRKSALMAQAILDGQVGSKTPSDEEKQA